MSASRSTNQISQGDSSPFSDVSSEKGALSCILQEGEQVVGGGVEILRQLTATDFYEFHNRSIFKTLEGISDRGESLYTLNLIKYLDGEVDIAYASNLVNEAPSPHQFPIYLKALKNAFNRRSVREILQTGLNLSNDPSLSPKGLLEELQHEIQKVAQRRSMSSGLPPIEEFEEFMARDIPRPTVLIKGLLHQGSKMLVSGGSKAHKTWILMDLALSVASGTPFLDLPTTQVNVLYINLELQDSFAKERFKKIRRAKGLPAINGLKSWNLRGYASDIEELRRNVVAQIPRHDLGLIIIDPIYKTYGDRDENRVSDIASIMNELEYICREGDVALVFAAHQTKGNQAGKESIDRISGSGAFARDVDSGLILTAHEEEGCYTVDASILRNFPEFDPYVLQWEYPLMNPNYDLAPERLKARRSSNPASHHTVEEIMAHVPVSEAIDKNVLRDNANKAGIALNKINPLINQAIEEGLLFEHLVKRSGTNPLKQIARFAQSLETDLHDPHDPHA